LGPRTPPQRASPPAPDTASSPTQDVAARGRGGGQISTCGERTSCNTSIAVTKAHSQRMKPGGETAAASTPIATMPMLTSRDQHICGALRFFFAARRARRERCRVGRGGGARRDAPTPLAQKPRVNYSMRKFCDWDRVFPGLVLCSKSLQLTKSVPTGAFETRHTSRWCSRNTRLRPLDRPHF
jgi:hypothetical protein